MFKQCSWLLACVCAASLQISSDAAAQQFNSTIFFGDSHSDPNPGPFGSTVWAGPFAAYFRGVSAPSDEPGGLNFARNGALVATDPGLGSSNPPSVRTQISTYLASTGGQADPHALYTVWVGTNDLFTGLGSAAEVQAAQNLVGELGRLSGAGARFILVPNIGTDVAITPPVYSQADADAFEARTSQFNDTLYQGLAAAQLGIIPLDYRAVVRAVIANGPEFGFTETSAFSPACGTASPCTASDLVSADALKTHVFLDKQGHYTPAVHAIFADYAYSIVIAPSLISMLAEKPVRDRLNLLETIRQQIPLSWRQQSSTGYSAWVTGSFGHLEIDGFSASANPRALTAGIDKKIQPNLLVGASVSLGTQTLDFGSRNDGKRLGDADEDEVTFSLYSAYRVGAFHLDLIGAYGTLTYDVSRNVPLGLSARVTSATARGSNISATTMAGYDFISGPVTSGPIAGITLQRVSVDGFRENGDDLVALTFSDQRRSSAITALGYQVRWNQGIFQPFGVITWNHELESGGREVTAKLNSQFSAVMPSYSMPALDLGRDWVTGTVGATARLSESTKLTSSVTGEFGQGNASNYLGRVGVNLAF